MQKITLTKNDNTKPTTEEMEMRVAGDECKTKMNQIEWKWKEEPKKKTNEDGIRLKWKYTRFRNRSTGFFFLFHSLSAYVCECVCLRREKNVSNKGGCIHFICEQTHNIHNVKHLLRLCVHACVRSRRKRQCTKKHPPTHKHTKKRPTHFVFSSFLLLFL